MNFGIRMSEYLIFGSNIAEMEGTCKFTMLASLVLPDHFSLYIGQEKRSGEQPIPF